MLSARGISRALGGKTVLSDLSLQVSAGSCVAILGQNGAGKSLALRSLCFLDPPDYGELELDGHVLRFPADYDSRFSPWPAVSMVFQQLFLWPHLTLQQSAELAAAATERSLPTEFGDYVDRLGARAIMSKRPAQCSLGERQKGALLRSLAQVHSLKYLLLDEPTAALDVEATHSVVGIIKELKLRGIGLAIISHQLGFVQRVCDQVVFMHEGRVVESGESRTLRAPGTTRFRQFLELMESY